MDLKLRGQWRSYLPVYRFPRVLRLTCGCLGLVLVGGGLFTFLIAPGLIAYVVTLDEEPVLEISTGQTIAIGDYGLHFARVASDSRCPGNASCDPADAMTLIFSTTRNNEEITVVIEGTEYSEPIALPDGYLMRVISVSADAFARGDRYTARIQIFQPPSPE